MAQAGTVWVDVRADGKSLARDIDRTARSAGSALGSVGKTVLTDVGRSTAVVAAGLAALGTAGVASLTAVGVEYNSLEQRSQAAFTTVLGTKEAAEEMMASLREFAKSSPFPRQAFITASQQLLAFGMQAEDVIPTLDAVQNAVAAAGGGAQEITEVADVLAKVTSTGKITAETLNQLGYRGIDAAALIGEGMGMSADAIRDEITSGTLDAEAAIDVLVEQMAVKFDGAADGVKETWTGAVDRIAGAWRDIGSDLVEPFISKSGGGYAVTWANEVADSMRHLQSTVIPALEKPIEAVAQRFAGAAESASEMVQSIDGAQVEAVFGRIESGASKLRESMQGLEGVAAGVGLSIAGLGARSVLGPLGGIVPVISPITGILGGLVGGSDEGREALKKLGKQAGDLARKEGPQLLRSMGDLAEELSRGLAGAMESVGGAALDAAEVLGPVLGESMRDLGPPLADLIEAGGELVAAVLPELASLAGSILPPAVDLLGTGLGIAAAAVELLAENSEILLPALAGLAAVKVFDTFASGASAVAGLASSFASGVGDVKTYFGVLREEGASVTAALSGAISESQGLGGAVGGALSSVNIAMAGVTAAAVIGGYALQQYADNKKRVADAADRLVDALEAERDVFKDLQTENLRELFIEKDALDAMNTLGISFADLSELTAAYGADLRKVDDAWRGAGGNIDKFEARIQRLPEPVREFAGTLVDLYEADRLDFGQVLRFFEAVDEAAQLTVDGMEEFRATAESIAREAFADGIIDAEQLEQALSSISEAKTPDELNAAFNELSGLLGVTGDEARLAADELRALNDELEKFSGAAADVDEAQRRLNESVIRVTESFAKNGAGINNTTKEGIANADAIQRMIEQARRLAEAQALTDVSGESSRQTFRGITDQLALMVQAGQLTQAEYEELLRIYELTPDAIETRIDADTNQAKADVADMDDRINALTGVSEPAKAEMRAALLRGEYESVRAQLNALEREYTATVKVRYEALQSNIFNAANPIGFIEQQTGVDINGNGIIGRELGGAVWPGQTFMVGEAGPELLRLNGATGEVIPNRETELLTDPKRQSGFEFNDAILAELKGLRADVGNIQAAQLTIQQYGATAETSPVDLLDGVHRAALSGGLPQAFRTTRVR